MYKILLILTAIISFLMVSCGNPEKAQEEATEAAEEVPCVEEIIESPDEVEAVDPEDIDVTTIEEPPIEDFE